MSANCRYKKINDKYFDDITFKTRHWWKRHWKRQERLNALKEIKQELFDKEQHD